MVLRLHRIGQNKKIAILIILIAIYCLIISHSSYSATKRVIRYLSQGKQFSRNELKNQIDNMTKHVQIQTTKITHKTKVPPRPKLILLYTAIFGQLPWRYTPRNYDFTEVDKTPCPVNNCRMTYDRSKIHQADVVEFHAYDLGNINQLRQLRQKVSPNQIWVWYQHESPIFYSLTNQLDGIFNWTQTYSTKSDIFIPYFAIKNNTGSISIENYAAGKSKIVLALNSHCDPPRVEFVRRLKKYIQVDFYGACQDSVNPELPRCDRYDPNCKNRLKQYKFFLAMENSLCDGYITEKYYENALQRGIVPIVFGGADYNDERIAIPHSFINVRDYNNLKELADYLHYLNKNDTAYNEYFDWKKDNVVVETHVLCRVCAKAWEPRPEKGQMAKISEFWSPAIKCENKKKVMDSFV